MAIGTVYTTPEIGWVRFEENNPKFLYSANWTVYTSANASGGTDKRNTIIGETIKFNFTGTAIRIIAPMNTDLAPEMKIDIDGNVETYSLFRSSLLWQVCVYEKTGLENKDHSVTITTTGSGIKILDAIDTFTTIPIKRLAIKNATTDITYSLSDNTLIHMPDSSNKNMILHGIEQGKEIQLDVPFDKHRYFNDTPVDGARGKVFTHEIGKINTLSIKEIRESKFVPTYNMIVTNMTANNAPTPFVASASSTHTNTSFQIWKAFNGTLIDANDAWISKGNYIDGIGSEWIQIDYGETKFINTLFLTHRAIATSYSPKEFEILGSNDEKNFEILHTVDNQADWGVGERRVFTFNNTQGYRYYRLKILEVNTTQAGAYVQIGEIQYGYKNEVK